jgi:hypothetical protein
VLLRYYYKLVLLLYYEYKEVLEVYIVSYFITVPFNLQLKYVKGLFNRVKV